MGGERMGVVRMFLLFAAAAAGGANAAADDVTAPVVADDKVEDCIELGFTGLNRCSDCDALRAWTKNDAVALECKRCCAKDSTKATTTFQQARLEICK